MKKNNTSNSSKKQRKRRQLQAETTYRQYTAVVSDPKYHKFQRQAKEHADREKAKLRAELEMVDATKKYSLKLLDDVQPISSDLGHSEATSYT